MLAFLVEIFTEIKDFIDDNWDTIRAIFEKFLGIIQGHWERVWDLIQEHVVPIWEGIKATISGALDIIKGIISTVMDIITGDWDGAWTGIKDTFSGIWAFITGLVSLGVSSIHAAWDTLVAFLTTGWEIAWAFIGETANAAWRGIKSVMESIINGIITGTEFVVREVIKAMNKIIGAWNNANLFLNFADISKIDEGFSLGRVDLTGGGGSFPTPGVPSAGGYGYDEYRSSQQAGMRSYHGINLHGDINITEAGDAKATAEELGWQLLVGAAS
jgi:phage-related protein